MTSQNLVNIRRPLSINTLFIMVIVWKSYLLPTSYYCTRCIGEAHKHSVHDYELPNLVNDHLVSTLRLSLWIGKLTYLLLIITGALEKLMGALFMIMGERSSRALHS
jgi:hypothetical protein